MGDPSTAHSLRVATIRHSSQSKPALLKFCQAKIRVRSQKAHITSGMKNFSRPPLPQALLNRTN